jgi:hypothetical protein
MAGSPARAARRVNALAAAALVAAVVWRWLSRLTSVLSLSSDRAARPGLKIFLIFLKNPLYTQFHG